MAYEGEGAYAALKVIAIVNVIAAIIIAIVLWANADTPHLVLEGGGVDISQEADPTTVATGALVLGEGIVVSLVMWAVGTIGQHVVAMRREVAPVAEPVSGWTPGTPGTQVAHPTPPEGYEILIRDLGGVDPAWIAKRVREYDLDVPMDPIVAGGVLVAGLSYAIAEPLRAELARKGVKVEMRKM